MLALRRLLLALPLLAAPYAPALAQGGPPAPQVGVSAPLARKVAQWDEYTGRFEAVAQVEVRARVSGFIDRIHFTDGQMIRAGDPLFTIDPRPYAIAVDSARADISRARSQVDRRAAPCAS